MCLPTASEYCFQMLLSAKYLSTLRSHWSYVLFLSHNCFKKSINQFYFRDNPILNDLDIIFIGICKSLNMLTHTPLLTESPEEFRMNHEIDLTPSYNVV